MRLITLSWTIWSGKDAFVEIQTGATYHGVDHSKLRTTTFHETWNLEHYVFRNVFPTAGLLLVNRFYQPWKSGSSIFIL